MKKLSFALGLLVMALTFAESDEQRPIDLVVVVDTSASMHASYRSVSEYVIGPMLKEFLRVGDTFHLISFSGVPRAEISRKIEGVGDVETIIGRMLLMYPLDPYSDVIAALEYVSRYLSDLPETRAKTIIFISDGEHSPPPTSPYAGLTPESVKTRLEGATTRLKGNGWTFQYLRVPFAGEGSLASIPGTKSSRPAESASQGGSASSKSEGLGAEPEEGKGRTEKATEQKTSPAGSAKESSGETAEKGLDVSDEVADLLAAPVVDLPSEDAAASARASLGAIVVEFPRNLGKTGRSLTIPLSVRNPSSEKVYLETRSVLVDGFDRMERRTFRELGPRSEETLKLKVRLPSDFPVGAAKILVEPVFTGSVRIFPPVGSVELEIAEAPFARFFSVALPGLLFALGLAAATLLALIVIVLSRRLASAPSRAVSSASGAVRPAAEKVPEQYGRTSTAETSTARSPGVSDPSSREGADLLNRAQSGSSDDGAALLAGFAKRSADDEASRSSIVPLAGTRRTETSLFASAGAPALPLQGSKRGEPAVRKAAAYLPNETFEVRRADARIMLSLFVEDQNTQIGRRNVHLLKAGTSLSLGGGNSDFLVFLVPLPKRIADVHFDGERCILVPRRPEFLPDLAEEPLIDCIGKTIKVVSQKGYQLTLRLDRFEDPLASLNRFLHSIDVPGR